ncbi:4Fe-4S dicluster domain-containing protein, partial [Escherichia coli]|uniref:4Fe-4S dicluster domain-containing protein n=1 Tax=Escherichia coli TaxID=562 RepID=UPI003CE4F37F
MFDRDTLIITYDAQRGEPRGPRRRASASAPAGVSGVAATGGAVAAGVAAAARSGDCIDCTWCVQVCPTG